MPRDGTASFLQIPQTPRPKSRFEESDDEDIIDRLPYAEGKKATGSSLEAPTGLRSRSISPYSRPGRRNPVRQQAPSSLSQPEHQTRKSCFLEATKRLWTRNRAVILVAVAQLFGATMNLCTRLLELDEEHGMHPFQILFFRMGITTVCSMIYMWYTNVPHFPLGAKDVRLLLVLRGTTGFVSYLPLNKNFALPLGITDIAGSTSLEFMVCGGP